MKLVLRKHSDSVIFSAESSDTLTDDEDVEVDRDDEIEGIGEVFSSETEVKKNNPCFIKGEEVFKKKSSNLIRGNYFSKSRKIYSGIVFRIKRFFGKVLKSCDKFCQKVNFYVKFD